MRLAQLCCAVALSLTVFATYNATAIAESILPSVPAYAAAPHTDGAHRRNTVVTASGGGGGASLLLGKQTLEPTSDRNGDGGAQAWSYTARASGTATGVQVYVNSGSSGSLRVGIYSNNGGNPGTLLASTSVPNTPGQWDRASLANRPNITRGTKYWLALLGTRGGSFAFRDNVAGSCTTVGTASGLSALPGRWSTEWAANGYCPASMYVTGAPGRGGGSGRCDLSATPGNLAAQVAAATAGETVCLASGNYGTWRGTNKAITVTAVRGATPRMAINFASGASGFTLSGMTGMSGSIDAGANTITITHSAFTDALVIDGLSNANILLDHDSFDNENEPAGCADQPARIHVEYSNGSVPSGVTVQNSTFVDSRGGLSNARDGIQTGTGMVIRNNLFENILDTPDDNAGCNHSDAIQAVGARGVVVTGNLFLNDADGFVDFDDATRDTVTDNACTTTQRGSCITLYGDRNSTVEHNSTIAGMVAVELDTKSEDRNGSGTIVRNNVGPVSVAKSTPAVDTNNLFSGAKAPNINGRPTFVGGASPTTWSGFELAPGSTGYDAGTDGSSVGIRARAGGPPGR